MTLGENKTVGFSKDRSSTYFSAITTEVGRLQITLNRKETGCGAEWVEQHPSQREPYVDGKVRPL